MKKLVILILALAVIQPMFTMGKELTTGIPATTNKHFTGYEQCPDAQAYPSIPGAICFVETVGTTWYEFQSNGSSGDRIVYHNDGTIHVCWMKLLGWPYPPSQRHVFYNWRGQNGNWSGEMQVSQNDPAGYCQMSEIYDTRAAIAYHETGGSNPTFVTLAVEREPPGMGFFDYFNPPDELFPQTPDSPGRLYWPYITVDRNDVIHIVASENTDRRLQRMAYTRSADAGTTWATPQLVDTVMVIGSVLDASPVSDKVVLAYCAPYDTTTQWQNDIAYYESDDGLIWDWRYGRHNITDYGHDNDSLWAYTDCDVIIDYNDVIHLVWNAQRLTENYVLWPTYLFHYRDDTGVITEITHHPDSLFADICGVWNRPICKMSLACSPVITDLVATTWTQFDTADVSMTGFGNGEIYLAYSFDGGSSWSSLENITNSPSPNCYPGECLSDHWSCMADDVSGYMPAFHVTYITDRDAGFAIEDEGAATENYVIYNSHEILDVEDENNLPYRRSLSQNHPNPFNAKSTISFNLTKPSPVTLEVFDITGAKVDMLIDEYLDAGQHYLTWDAEHLASGVYFYKLTTDLHTDTRKAVLIK